MSVRRMDLAVLAPKGRGAARVPDLRIATTPARTRSSRTASRRSQRGSRSSTRGWGPPSGGDEEDREGAPKAVEALAKHDPKLEDRLTNRVDVLKDRFATLADTVADDVGEPCREGRRDHQPATRARGGARAPGGARPSTARRLPSLEELPRTSPSPQRSARSGARPSASAARRGPGKLEILQQRLDTLAGRRSTTAAGLASRTASSPPSGDGSTTRPQASSRARGAADRRRPRWPELKLNVKELSGGRRPRAPEPQGNRRPHRAADAVTDKVDALGATAATTAGDLASADRRSSRAPAGRSTRRREARRARREDRAVPRLTLAQAESARRPPSPTRDRGARRAG